MNYLNNIVESTRRNSKRIGLAVLVGGSVMTTALGAFSYANYAMGNKYNSRAYGGLAAISLGTTALGALVLREENYKDRSPRHKKMRNG